SDVCCSGRACRCRPVHVAPPVCPGSGHGEGAPGGWGGLRRNSSAPGVAESLATVDRRQWVRAMSDTYTKLFSSITESTVWGEPYATRIVWVAMLAMADARGNVFGSVPGLARRANVNLEEAERALDSFRAPDQYSRSKEADGRRVEDIDGGWRLINHGKYRTIRGSDERREYKREWDRMNRSKAAKLAQRS